MKIYAPEYGAWRDRMRGEEITLSHRNQKRPAPDRVELCITLERLREFYAAGVPFLWSAA